MKIYAPDYYNDFECIKDKCNHSCCIGWEIDIDKDTLEKYKKIDGPFAERLKNNIINDDNSYFKLGLDNRCPFLNEDNLCDIYIELGKDFLCQICSDHPRFRNFFDTRTEIGIGMCCEASAEIILTHKPKMTLIPISENNNCEHEDEEVFFNLRKKAFDIIQNRDICVDKRIENLIKAFEIEIPQKTFDEWIDVYLSLENLDEGWTNLLKKSRGKKIGYLKCFDKEKWQIAFEQLIIYFIYRHMHEGIVGNNISAYLAFCIVSFNTIRNLCAISGETSLEEMQNISRMYSSEIEYSTENMDELIFEIEIG